MQEVELTSFFRLVPLSRRSLAELLQCGESTVRAAEREIIAIPAPVERWTAAMVAFFERNPPPPWRTADGPRATALDTHVILQEFFDRLPVSRHRLASMLKCSEGTLRLIQKGEVEAPRVIDAWLREVVLFLRENPPPTWSSTERRGRR